MNLQSMSSYTYAGMYCEPQSLERSRVICEKNEDEIPLARREQMSQAEVSLVLSLMIPERLDMRKLSGNDSMSFLVISVLLRHTGQLSGLQYVVYLYVCLVSSV